MNKFTGALTALLLFIAGSTLSAQQQVPMADKLRAEGKIYVVVIIVLIVLIGLIFYLFSMDRKVKKLEKMLSDKKKQTN
jgi:CcmD family protein